MRRPSRLIVAMLLLVVADCSNDVKVAAESDLLPEADLAFPGAVARSRSFAQAEKGTCIDGQDFNHPNELSLTFDLEQPVLGQTIVDWYSDAMTESQWSVIDEHQDGAYFQTEEGGWTHGYTINLTKPANAESTSYQVFYRLT